MEIFHFTILLALTATAVLGRKSHYDHQTETYTSQHKGTGCRKAMNVTSYFSPDHSIEMYVSLINSATESIDIFTPGFSSWSFCTPFDGCQGCTIERLRTERFPVFATLLNAKNKRKVKVRILTNNFRKTTCEGKIAPLDWLAINGIEVRTYTTTTFLHAKFMIIDKGKKTSISSVNFSYTSFMRNREAGVVLEGGCKASTSFHNDVFEYDWNKGTPYMANNTYSDEEMEKITDPSPYPVEIPNRRVVPEAYISKVTTMTDVKVKKVFTTPDFARNEIRKTIRKTKVSFDLAIYEVTDSYLCDKIKNMFKKGINVRVLASPTIVSKTAKEKAEACYKQLYEAGMAGQVRYGPSYYRHYHQKFWIVDNTTVHLSSGNWAPTSYPNGNTFPPYGDLNWQRANRDMLVKMKSQSVVDAFYKVFIEDWKRGTEWIPPCDRNTEECDSTNQ